MIVSQDMVIRLGILVLALAVVPFAHAQEAKIVSVSDAAADIPGAMTIRGCTAPDLPHPESAIPQLPGWPVTVPCDGTFAPFRNVVFADLDGDGQLEIIAAS